MPPRWRRARVVFVTAVGVLALVLTAVEPAFAHGGSLGAGGREPVTVPTWLVLLTGGAAVGGSFLLASFVTDRQFIDAIESWSRSLPVVPTGQPITTVLCALGIVGLGVVVTVGLVAPQSPLANLGLLIVWVGWWAGVTMATYLLGNAWPVLSPWQTMASWLPSLGYSYPDRAGVWPATTALLAFVWLEVVSPVADVPRVLVGVVLAYSIVTLTGAAVYGREDWFDNVDPIARVFDHYGHVAPIQRDGDSLSIRLPGSALDDLAVSDRSEVAFVVALLWVTTFDGFVATPAWQAITTRLSAVVPLAALYPLALVAGFGLFLGAYRLASRASKHIADTYLTAAELGRQFAPSLLAIAAGYHFAHYFGYFVSLAPALVTVAGAPLNPPLQVPVLTPPAWFELVGMGAILVGHLLAIWVAHSTAYDIFPGRLQAVRSQYPFIAVMVFYTMTSLWIIAQPEVAVP